MDHEPKIHLRVWIGYIPLHIFLMSIVTKCVGYNSNVLLQIGFATSFSKPLDPKFQRNIPVLIPNHNKNLRNSAWVKKHLRITSVPHHPSLPCSSEFLSRWCCTMAMAMFPKTCKADHMYLSNIGTFICGAQLTTPNLRFPFLASSM